MSDVEINPVREAHRFDEDALHRYLSDSVAGYAGPLRVRQFDGGQSNPTFLLEAGSGSYVMRKQPPRALLASAHQVDREYRVMDALGAAGVPVPRIHALYENPAVIGTKFYVMKHVEGRLVTDTLMPSTAPPARCTDRV